MDDSPTLAQLLHETTWRSRVLLILSLALPALLAISFAAYQHRVVIRQEQESAQRSAVALEQHAANVLDSHSLLVRQLEGITRDRTAADISTDSRLKRTLVELTHDFDQLAAVGIVDSEGRLILDGQDRASARVLLADRDYFQSHKTGAVQGLFVGQANVGRRSGRRQFPISIARRTSSGAFDGVIYTTVPLEYFETFWRQFTPSGGHLIPLMRADGALIARYPTLDTPERLSATGPFMTNVRRQPNGIYTARSLVDGVERINAYRQVEHYPLYISFSVETGLATAQWWAEIVPAMVGALLMAAALVALWLAVIRRSHQERVAAERWRAVAAKLEAEIARRSEAEEQLRQSRKMEALGQLAGGIAHDFNNMLAGIVGNLQLMRLRLGRGETAELPRDVAAAEAVAAKASAIIQRVLSFSRREAFAATVIDVNERIESMRPLIRQSVGARIEVELKAHAGHCLAMCDPYDFDSAVLNLAINARDAMPQGGTLEIGTSIKSVPECGETRLQPGRYVVISVSDNGAGMPPEIVQRAFDPFFTTKPIGQGTGLGLSTVYGFARQSGGEAVIESAVGAGTTVSIFLPLHEGSAPAAAQG